MTRGSTWEYAEALRGRYVRAGKKGKGRILDQFVAVTGYHRKAAIRLLGRDRGSRPRAGPGADGETRHYGPEVASALRALWEAADPHMLPPPANPPSPSSWRCWSVMGSRSRSLE